MSTTGERARRMLPLRAKDGSPVDCTIAHITGPTIACATCELNKLRDQSRPSKPGWMQACIIALSVAVPVIAVFVTLMLLFPN